MHAIILQPPLVQLNTAYPSGAYLCAFFRKMNCTAVWHDLSIALISKIFCREGLERLFTLTEKSALRKAAEFRGKGDDFSADNIESYILQKDLWISWIDSIMLILQDGGSSSREISHQFVYSPFVPRGNRMLGYLENLEGSVQVDDARNLAGAALEDLADYITVVFDSSFSLIRYAESIAVNETKFSDIESALDSPVLSEFYDDVLEDGFGDGKKILDSESNGKTLVCISVPFPGTFTAALYTARWFRKKYGDSVFIIMGGGFINTELRDFKDTQFALYADAISFDRGYGSYKRLLENFPSVVKDDFSSPIYKLRVFKKDRGIDPLEDDSEAVCFENEITSSLVPDYSDIDFSKYPRMADDTNPMQRIWSDGSWLKAYLAHGCYWHRCAFCDVTLDYVKSYRMTNIAQLFDGLHAQAMGRGIRGIHFVDEALPPVAMIRFSEKNFLERHRLSYWGNVRFEKTYTRDMTDFLSAGGLTGVSGGIEIATGSGLDKIHKGTDLDSIVSACCAFKESGVLIHAYMIYGYFGETEQDTINSMETLRQFFEVGLLDSCFWHKFVLTRHSRLYDDWKKGLCPGLEPREPEGTGIFAKNGLHFAGERKSEKYGAGLNMALQSWMHGEKINMSVNKWFDFKTVPPSIPKNLVSKAVENYERKREAHWNSRIELEKCHWLGGSPVVRGKRIQWMYLQELHEINFSDKESREDVEKFLSALKSMSAGIQDREPMKEFLGTKKSFWRIMEKLRGNGLVQL